MHSSIAKRRFHKRIAAAVALSGINFDTEITCSSSKPFGKLLSGPFVGSILGSAYSKSTYIWCCHDIVEGDTMMEGSKR